MKIVLDIKAAHILRRATYPDLVGLELEDGGEILAEAVSDTYSKLCSGRLDIEFRCPHGTAEKVLKELGVPPSTFDLFHFPATPKFPFTASAYEVEQARAEAMKSERAPARVLRPKFGKKTK